MGKFYAVKGEDDKGKEAFLGHCCVAHGCPLVGSISDATDGSGAYRCWAHDRAEESSQWPYLTAGIRANAWLFRMADKVMWVPLYEVERSAGPIEEYLTTKGRSDLQRTQNDGRWPDTLTHEPRSFWVQRLRGAAFEAAMGYVSEHWTPSGVARRRAVAAECAES